MVCCPRPIDHQADPHGEAGYSLLEILFALAIFALIISISGGIGIRALNAQGERTEQRQILQAIEMLRYGAVIEETNIQIASFADWPQNGQRPETDWIFEAAPPLLINKAGQCSASEIRLTSPRDRTYRYRANPDCSLAAL